jgi:hypothetical protein
LTRSSVGLGSPEEIAVTRALPLFLCLAACSPTWEAEPIASPGADDTVLAPLPSPEGVPDAVDSFLSPENLQALEAVGMPIHRGEVPPMIEGLYLAETLTVIHDAYPSVVGTVVIPLTVGFDGQHDDGSVDATQDDEVSTATGSGAFLSGSDGCFSAYLDLRGYSEQDDCSYSMPQIVSACMGEDGLEDFVIGYVMAATSGPCGVTVPRGYRRILEEADGTAERLGTS